MSTVNAVLTIMGFAVVLWPTLQGLVAWRKQVLPPEVDLAAPYREGLHAAIRMQGVAQDLEQQLYAEAVRLKAEAEVVEEQP